MNSNADQQMPAPPTPATNKPPDRAGTIDPRGRTQMIYSLPIGEWAEGPSFSATIARRSAIEEAAIAAFFLRPAPICITGRLVS